MTNTTTIQLDEKTKQRLEERKRGSESYDDVVRELLGDDSGDRWTEEEIRQMAHDEAMSVVESYSHR